MKYFQKLSGKYSLTEKNNQLKEKKYYHLFLRFNDIIFSKISFFLVNTALFACSLLGRGCILFAFL